MHDERDRGTFSFLVFAFTSGFWTLSVFLSHEFNFFTVKIPYALGIFVGFLGLVWIYYFLNNRLNNIIN